MTIVIKLGTGVLTSGIGQLDRNRMAEVARQTARLRANGASVHLVSSGAVGLGMGVLKLAKKPKDLTKKQACAAIGQSLLMQAWQEAFAPLGLSVAQVLLTHDDLRVRARHLGVRRTLEQLVDFGIVPVINENDAVSGAEIQVGDNDRLSAMVASLLKAGQLIILTTAPGLIDYEGTGKVVPFVARITPAIEAMARGTKSETAVGGMATKIIAAKIATGAGASVTITDNLDLSHASGTFFAPATQPLEAKKRWLIHFQRPTGTLRIDANAVVALREKGRSLLAVGVLGSTGTFPPNDVVNIEGPDRTIVARGTVSYSSDELARIAGRHEAEIRVLFPERKRLEVVHRDDLALL